MRIRRTTFVITQKCTLKCKLCLAFMPYYKNPVNTTLEEAERIVNNYFNIVDEVQIFSITGGEPLVNPELVNIIKKVLTYRDKITNTIDIVTNGTLMFRDDLLELLEKNNDKIRIIISNYGKELSTKMSQIEDALVKRDIMYRIQNYASESDEWTYNGWVDFSDHSLKHDTEDKLIEQGKKCIFRLGHYYVINDGELHPCSRQYWRMREGIMEKDEQWYIDLNVKDLDVQSATQKLKQLEETKYLKSCGYCNGVYNGIKRYKPAEQL